MRGLPLDTPPPAKSSSRLFRLLAVVLLVGGGSLLACTSTPWSTTPRTAARDFVKTPVACPAQPAPLTPKLTFSPPASDAEKRAYVERLRGAVRIPTETFDNAPESGSDVWYDKFYPFEEYLRETFPDVFGALEVETHATHGLLLTWKGTDASLQPIVLMAHQDTVPVPEETVSRWTHPPFDAHLDDDGWLWGRGSVDCKNLLIAELSAVSGLLAAGFKPTRTIHLSFGFDEEGGAVHSARYLAAHLESIYGRDSVFIIVDEGGQIQPDTYGKTWITPSLGEKGSVNVRVSVNVPGGHSSVPPAHTAIGILSALVSTIEAHPPAVSLSPKNPFAQFVMCTAEHGTIDPALRALLAHERTWPAAAALIASRSPADAARLSTTQAVDIVGGGVKVNALPEEAHAVVNHRVAGDDSIAALQARYVEMLSPVASEYNLSVVAFDDAPPIGVARYLRLSTPGGAEASPVTPAEGDAWDVFAGTARHLYPAAIVAPHLSTGGTDTRSFVNLTRAIYRFQAIREDLRVNAHTVDERVHVDGHISVIQFVHALIQNADAFRG